MKWPARSIFPQWLIQVLLNLRGLFNLRASLNIRAFKYDNLFWALNGQSGLPRPDRSVHLKLLAFPFIFCLVLISGGCVQLDDPEASQDYRAQVVAVARPDQPVGQSFVARRTPLKTIQLWLRLESGGPDQPGSLTAELYRSQGESSPLVSIPLSASAISSHFPIAISIPDFDDPPEQSYYLSLVASDFPVQVFGRTEDAYPRGSLDQNKQQLPGDVSFRLSYEYDFRAVLEDFRRGLLDLWLIIPLSLTIWLPGWLVMDGFQLGRGRDWAERIALAVGLSLAVIAVVLIWTSWLGISFDRISIALIMGLLVLLSTWRVWRHRSEHAETASPAAAQWTNWALAVIFFVSLWVRMAMVRDLAAPPWVDSVHHGMITRLILSEGQLPQNYTPFLDIETANYHTGFHGALAIFSWLSGLDLARSMLVFGQVLNALSIFAAYLFTTTFTESRTAGVFAALVTGLFLPMPAYLTSWGRYPQLASLLVLPAAVFLIQQALNEDPAQGPQRPQVRLILSAGLACGGLLLIHYRVIAFMALLLIAWQIVRSLGYFRQQAALKYTFLDISRLSLIALAASGWTLPWLPAILQSIFPKLDWASLPIKAFSDFSWGFLTSAWGLYALYAAGAGILAGLILKKRFPWIFGLWLGLMIILANPALLGLPGGGFVNNISVEISLFLPISAAAGFLPGWLLERSEGVLSRKWHAFLLGLVSIGGVVVALYAGSALMPILNPGTFLFREADRQAMRWIEDHLPADETVLINPFAWGYGLYAGNDGGFWIAPLAGHPTLPPPALYGLGNQADTIQSISDLSRRVIDLGAQPDELRAFLLEQDIQYIYTGARGGAISPASLEASTDFRTLYRQDGTWVFEVVDIP
jgi:hypothetical protein